MFEVSTNLMNYKNDLQDLINLFELKEQDNVFIDCDNNDKCVVKVVFNKIEQTYVYDAIKNEDELVFNRELKHNVKSSLYKMLSYSLNKKLAWGSLTGVRPARLVYNNLEQGKTLNESVEKVSKEYFLSKQKTSLLHSVLKTQFGVIKNDNSICFYIHIPICPTRCVYCSFVSTDFAHAHTYLNEYIIALKEEIEYSLKLIKEKSIQINSIYVGGGTPTVLSADQLTFLLEPLSLLRVPEFTVECGRADTITKEKLQALANLGVTRISINPQTFNDEVLKIIGRTHTAEQVCEAYKLAREFDFDINMDFIAGLPNDDEKSFKQSINKAIELNPENITVHTLSIKNAGLLKYMKNATLPQAQDVSKMLDYAYKKLQANGYIPYYLYRQKNMLGFFENVGYCKQGKECLFNIYSMEDLKGIIACGAGAISKKIHKQNNFIERVANVKQISDYLTRNNEMLKRKDYLLT